MVLGRFMERFSSEEQGLCSGCVAPAAICIETPPPLSLPRLHGCSSDIKASLRVTASGAFKTNHVPAEEARDNCGGEGGGAGGDSGV